MQHRERSHRRLPVRCGSAGQRDRLAGRQRRSGSPPSGESSCERILGRQPSTFVRDADRHDFVLRGIKRPDDRTPPNAAILRALRIGRQRSHQLEFFSSFVITSPDYGCGCRFNVRSVHIKMRDHPDPLGIHRHGQNAALRQRLQETPRTTNPASSIPKMTMFVCTFAGSSEMPGIAAKLAAPETWHSRDRSGDASVLLPARPGLPRRERRPAACRRPASCEYCGTAR